MADVHGSLFPHDLIEPAVNLILRHGIQGGSGLIQDHKRCVLIKSPGQGHFLGFPSRNLYPVLVEIFVKIGTHALFKLLKPLPQAGLFQTGNRLFFIIGNTGSHILPQGKGKQLKILEYHGKNGLVFFIVILFDINAV